MYNAFVWVNLSQCILGDLITAPSTAVNVMRVGRGGSQEARIWPWELAATGCRFAPVGCTGSRRYMHPGICELGILLSLSVDLHNVAAPVAGILCTLEFVSHSQGT